MLTPNGIKQEISFAYIHLLALRLGYSVEIVRTDMDSVDVSICAKGKIKGSKGLILSPKIDVQLKTTKRECSQYPISFNLPQKNYNELRMNTMVPRMLGVVFLPVDRDWFDFDLGKITLDAQAYWMSLKGLNENDHRVSTTIYFSEAQMLDEKTLHELMISAANREDIAYASC
jgi:Domain of unknown function (DUF4365)